MANRSHCIVTFAELERDFVLQADQFEGQLARLKPPYDEMTHQSPKKGLAMLVVHLFSEIPPMLLPHLDTIDRGLSVCL